MIDSFDGRLARDGMESYVGHRGGDRDALASAGLFACNNRERESEKIASAGLGRLAGSFPAPMILSLFSAFGTLLGTSHSFGSLSLFLSGAARANRISYGTTAPNSTTHAAHTLNGSTLCPSLLPPTH